MSQLNDNDRLILGAMALVFAAALGYGLAFGGLALREESAWC